MLKAAFLVLSLTLVTGCAGGGQTLASPPHTCPAFSGGDVTDPMTQPADGARGVSPAVGSITVPIVDGLAGHTGVLVVSPPGTGGATLATSAFVQSGAMLTATIPPLAANTTYYASADVLVSAGTGPLGCDVHRLYVLGLFTTQ